MRKPLALCRIILGIIAASVLVAGAPAHAADTSTLIPPVGDVIDMRMTDSEGERMPGANGTRIGPGETALVRATDCDRPGATSVVCPVAPSPDYDELTSPIKELSATCRMLYDTGVGQDKPFFIPWNTPKEWGAFLANPPPQIMVTPNACCPAKKATDVFCGGNTLQSLGLPDEMGRRIAPVRQKIIEWTKDPAAPEHAATLINGVPASALIDRVGAEGEPFTINADAALTAAGVPHTPINYEITYTCQGGQWILTRQVGACTPTDGTCAVNNPPQGLPSLPTNIQDLCGPGSGAIIGPVDGGNKWTWQCPGTPGKTTASCSALKVPPAYNGQCGPANGGRLPAVPFDPADLCSRGTPTPVTGTGIYGCYGCNDGRWRWSCTGSPGKSNADCSAIASTSPFPGQCGDCNGWTIWGNNGWLPPGGMDNCGCRHPFNSPMPDPVITHVATPTEPSWSWTCLGVNGGVSNTTCKAYLPIINGQCGIDSNYVINNNQLPDNACQNGTPVNVLMVGNKLTWTCKGENTGTDAQCVVNVNLGLTRGVCNFDWGEKLSAPPKMDELCASGTAANYVKTGLLNTWKCQGNDPNDPEYEQECLVYGGNPIPGRCGSASEQINPIAPSPSEQLCAAGVASPIEAITWSPGDNGWEWNCTDQAGGLYIDYCWRDAQADYVPPPPPPPVNGTCGPASAISSVSAPVTGLCATGTATPVAGTGPWTWFCTGQNGGTTSWQCSTSVANVTGLAGCGLAGLPGNRLPNTPNTNLCAVGNVNTLVTPAAPARGPWTWGCTGTDGTVSCSAGVCDDCTGAAVNTVIDNLSDSIANQTISYGAGECPVQGTVSWEQTSKIVPSNASYILTMTNTDSGLIYTKGQVPTVAPANYCTGCYRRPQSVSGNFKVKKATTGTCASGPPLSSGGTATIPITGSTISPP
ncbi:MAG: hypothetical protein WDO70_08580 [Alphaproteobacteria bacterium]